MAAEAKGVAVAARKKEAYEAKKATARFKRKQVREAKKAVSILKVSTFCLSSTKPEYKRSCLVVPSNSHPSLLSRPSNLSKNLNALLWLCKKSWPESHVQSTRLTPSASNDIDSPFRSTSTFRATSRRPTRIVIVVSLSDNPFKNV